MKETNSQRPLALMSLLHNGLRLHAAKTTQAQLGDRKRYVGLSDIAAFSVCPRKAVLQKQQPGTANFAKTLTLQRGHWYEDGIASALEATGLSPLRQLEIAVTYKGVPIKAHLDLVLVSSSPTPTIRILEVKSMTALPEHVYANHELQAYGQIALFHAYYNRHVFSLRDEQGTPVFTGLSFPEVVARLWGESFPDNIRKINVEAWLLALTMTDGKGFGPYHYNKTMKTAILDMAVQMYGLLPHPVDRLPVAEGFHPLCSCCDHAVTCPKFAGPEHPELAQRLQKLVDWKTDRTALDERIKEAEADMKEWYARTDAQGDWVIAGKHRFKVVPLAGRRTLDKHGLANELSSLMRDQGIALDVPALFAKHEKQGAPGKRLMLLPFSNTITDA